MLLQGPISSGWDVWERCRQRSQLVLPTELSLLALKSKAGLLPLPPLPLLPAWQLRQALMLALGPELGLGLELELELELGLELELELELEPELELELELELEGLVHARQPPARPSEGPNRHSQSSALADRA